MTAEELKQQIFKMLENCGNAEQESGWIVSRATAIPVMEILFSRRPLEESETARAQAMAERRRNGEPLQYILGDEYFGDLLLKVGRGCLIPRPETWGMVEFLTPRIPAGGSCCELGVGSGAVSIAIGRARSDVSVFGSELSADALYWAKRNLAAYDLPNVEFRQGSLFEPFPGMKFDAVAANLPYIPFREKENLQREDLSPIEAARAIRTLMTEFNMTQETAADRIGVPAGAAMSVPLWYSISPVNGFSLYPK